mgnify:CR=1 FL=1
MTVQELIDELSKVEDKTMKVTSLILMGHKRMETL